MLSPITIFATLLAAQREKLLADLKVQSYTFEEQRAFMMFEGPCGRQAITWEIYQVIELEEGVAPGLLKEILVLNLCSDDRDMAFGALSRGM